MSSERLFLMIGLVMLLASCGESDAATENPEPAEPARPSNAGEAEFAQGINRLAKTLVGTLTGAEHDRSLIENGQLEPMAESDQEHWKRLGTKVEIIASDVRVGFCRTSTKRKCVTLDAWALPDGRVRFSNARVDDRPADEPLSDPTGWGPWGVGVARRMAAGVQHSSCSLPHLAVDDLPRDLTSSLVFSTKILPISPALRSYCSMFKTRRDQAPRWMSPTDESPTLPGFHVFVRGNDRIGLLGVGLASREGRTVLTGKATAYTGN